MKRILILVGFVAVLVLCAAAQASTITTADVKAKCDQYITFTDAYDRTGVASENKAQILEFASCVGFFQGATDEMRGEMLGIPDSGKAFSRSYRQLRHAAMRHAITLCGGKPSTF